MSRRRNLAWLFGLLLFAFAVFWFFPAWLPNSARDALLQPDRFELFSLGDPDYSKPLPDGLFHRRVMLGSTLIADSQVQAKLVRALSSGVTRFHLPPMCFNPRHCIRVTHGDVVTDLLICFECQQAEVWRKDERIGEWMTNDSPQKVFDQVLTDNGVPLPKPE